MKMMYKPTDKPNPLLYTGFRKWLAITLCLPLLSAGCVLAQPQETAADVPPAPIEQRQIIRLLLDAADLDISAIPSCEHAAYPGARTLGDYLSHYLSVLSEEGSIAIAVNRTDGGGDGRTGEASMRFIVQDPESPWDYGFRFRYRDHMGAEGINGFAIEPQSLSCIGAG